MVPKSVTLTGVMTETRAISAVAELLVIVLSAMVRRVTAATHAGVAQLGSVAELSRFVVERQSTFCGDLAVVR